MKCSFRMQYDDVITNPRWRTDGRHIENRFLELISQRHIDRSTRNLERRWRITYRYRSRDQNCNFRKFKMADGRHFENSIISISQPRIIRFRSNLVAVRSVTLNLANKFSQCTFIVAEHYDLFSDLIILRQAWWHRSYDVIPHRYRPHRTDRDTAAGKAQRYHTDLKLIFMLPIMSYAMSRQFTVDGHFKSDRNNRRRLYKAATPTR